MASAESSAVVDAVVASQAPNATNGTEQPQKTKENGPAEKAQDETAPSGEKKLTNAELKARQKAEKAAKRAAAKGTQQGAPPTGSSSQAGGAQQKADGAKGGKPQQKKQGGAPVADSRALPVRGGAQKAVAPVVPEAPKKEDKTVEFFRHLYKPRTFNLAGVNKDVHPAVLALGLQMSSYTICGSCARLVATLQAFKRVCLFSFILESYTDVTRSSNHTQHLQEIP